ncbi:hypothetical protein BDZ94DRAFT_1308854 [Collybia nuda]|uniref:non-specific serine/threonine protein kinase n=1 Tax=Collybia nuda TaxID=64659 RepID=A0A9P5Y8P2_9AGAR|nr:hypothetical protein BDZ94DRAFT_1308854 [Collybia nuda]
MYKNDNAQNIGETLGIHRGAIDQETITTQPPPRIMKRVEQALMSMGVEIQIESEYKYRCIRPRRPSVETAGAMGDPTTGDSVLDDSETTPKAAKLSLPSVTLNPNDSSTFNSDTETTKYSSTQDVVYGDRTEEPGDEVRFSVELTRLDRLEKTFSLDIRRLKGNLRSYKFLYDTLRQ